MWKAWGRGEWPFLGLKGLVEVPWVEKGEGREMSESLVVREPEHVWEYGDFSLGCMSGVRGKA